MADEKARSTSPGRFALGVAAIAALAWLAARAALSPGWDWLWRDAVGRPPWPPVMAVAAIEAPLYLGAGAIAAVAAVAIFRRLRRGQRRGAAATALVGLAGCLVLAAVFAELRRETFPPPDLGGRVRPRSAFEVFAAEQWRALAAELGEGHRLRPEEFGIEGEPGWIPIDEALLCRFSFLGMTPAAVAAILGPARPPGPLGTSWYRMAPVSPEMREVRLVLHYDYDDRLRVVVVHERMERRRYRVRY